MLNLQTYLAEHSRIAPDAAIRMLITLCEQWQKQYSIETIHGAIDPYHILISTEGDEISDCLLTSEKNQSAGSHADPWSAIELSTETDSAGPWTDVYSLAAVAYKCITGMEPEPASQRLLFDEIQPFSALGIDIDENTEKVVMRGLEVLPEKRYQSIQSFLEALTFADQERRQEEERDRQNKRIHRRQKVFLIFGLIAAVLAAGGLISESILKRQREDIFRGKETETIALASFKADDPEDFEFAADTIQQRLQYYLDDAPCRLERQNDSLYITTLYETWNNIDPEEFTKTWIAEPWNLQVISQCRIMPIERTDLEQITVLQENAAETNEEDGPYWYVEIKLRPETGEAIRSIAETDPEANIYLDGAVVNVSYDLDSAIMKFGRYTDRKLAELAKYIFEQPCWKNSLNYSCDTHVEWESITGNSFVGKLQMNAESIPDPSVTFIYGEPYDEDVDPDADKGAWIRYMTGYKQRLDAFGKKYAIGVCSDADRRVAIKMHSEDADAVLMETLCYDNYSMWIGNSWEVLYPLSNWETVYSPEKGELRVKLQEGSYTENIQKYNEMKDKMTAHNQSRLYLYLGSYRMMATDIGREDVLDTNELIFTENLYPPEDDERTTNYGSYLCEFAQDFDMGGARLQSYVLTDKKGNLVIPTGESDICQYRNEENTLCDDIKKLFPSVSVTVERRLMFGDSDETYLKIYLKDSDYPTAAEFLEAVKALVKEADLLRGEYPWINIYLLSEDDIRRSMLHFSANKDTYGYDLLLYSTDREWDHAYYKEIAELLQEDSFFEPYITADTFLY